MREASPRALSVLAHVVEITLGDDSKRADRRQRAAFGAVNLVHAVTLAYLLSVASSREVEILVNTSREFALIAVSLACCRRGCRSCGPRSRRGLYRRRIEDRTCPT